MILTESTLNYKVATVLHIFMSEKGWILSRIRIRIGKPGVRIRQNDADPTESRSRSDRFLTKLVRRMSKLKSLKKRNSRDELTINVPVVYMGRYEVVLRGDYP
jgi:hypothetical protein